MRPRFGGGSPSWTVRSNGAKRWPRLNRIRTASRFASDGDQRRVGWLVGCDGAHSRVRELAGVGFPGVPLAERFLLVDAHADLPLSRRTIYVWLDADTVFGAFPLPGQDVWRLMVPTIDPGTEADPMTDEAVLAEVTPPAGRTDWFRSSAGT